MKEPWDRLASQLGQRGQIRLRHPQRQQSPKPEEVVVGQHLGRPRDLSASYELPDEPGDIGIAGDARPEGLVFILFHQSPKGRAVLVAANEVSGTTTVYGCRAFPSDHRAM